MNLHTQKNRTHKVEKSILDKILCFLSLRREPEIHSNDRYDETEELLKNLHNARRDWLNAYSAFDYVDDQEIIDYYTYKIKAYQVRYEYFLKRAKEKGIKVEMLEPVSAINYYDDVKG